MRVQGLPCHAKAAGRRALVPPPPSPSPPPSPTLPPCPPTRPPAIPTVPMSVGFDLDFFCKSNPVPGEPPLSYGFEIQIESLRRHVGRVQGVPCLGVQCPRLCRHAVTPGCFTPLFFGPFPYLQLPAGCSAHPLRAICLLSAPDDSIPRPRNNLQAGPPLRRSLNRHNCKLTRFHRASTSEAAPRSPRHGGGGKTRKSNAIQVKSPLV